MIDRIVRKSYYEYWIIYFDRKPVVIKSSGNAKALMEYLLYAKVA